MIDSKFIFESATSLYQVEALLSEEDILQMANKISQHRFKKGQAFETCRSGKKYLQALYQDSQREIFGVITLDSQHRLISKKDLFFGTLNSAAVYPREVVKEVLLDNAAAAFIYHNHPSGLSAPSDADIKITREIKKALSYIDVTLLDHFVIGREDVSSLAESGLM